MIINCVTYAGTLVCCDSLVVLCVREECVMGCVMLYDRVKLSLFDSCTPLLSPTIKGSYTRIYVQSCFILYCRKLEGQANELC